MVVWHDFNSLGIIKCQAMYKLQIFQETLSAIIEETELERAQILSGCKIEDGIGALKAGDTFQFMRQGYFCVDTTTTEDKLVFNRTVALNSSWK